MNNSYLFAAHAASMGHLNPMLTIARQLQGMGKTCVLTGHATSQTARAIQAQGVRFIPIRPSLQNAGLLLLPLTSGFLETFVAFLQFFGGLAHHARAILPILDELRPAAVATDFTFLGAGLAAEMRGIPYVTVCHAGLSFKGDGIPPFGSGLPIGEEWGWPGRFYRYLSDFAERRVDRKIARARRRLGLTAAPANYLSCPASPWLSLALTAEALEAPRFPLPPTFFFIGPCFAGRAGGPADAFPWHQLATDQPRIYVSLGTFFNNKPHIFRKIMAAFADGRHQLIISAGGAFEALQADPFPAHVHLFKRVPQVEVLPRVDAVISHGGNNTVNETLAAGKPLLVLPVGGEQGDNASRVVYLGAGLRADLCRSTPSEIRAKVVRLIGEPGFRLKAQAIAEKVSRTQGPATAARFIERLAQTRQPIRRPEGYPLTVTRDLEPPWPSRESAPEGRILPSSA